MPHTILYTAEEIPEAVECAINNFGCELVKVTRWKHLVANSSIWYEPCEDHQPKGKTDEV